MPPQSVGTAAADRHLDLRLLARHLVGARDRTAVRARTGAAVADGIEGGEPPHAVGLFGWSTAEALQNLFVQVLAILQMEKLITLERVTVDGTKVRAAVNKKTFSRAHKIREHLKVARQHVEELQKQEAEQEKRTRGAAARRRAARERVERLEEALVEVERLQAEKKWRRKNRARRQPPTRMRSSCGPPIMVWHRPTTSNWPPMRDSQADRGRGGEQTAFRIRSTCCRRWSGCASGWNLSAAGGGRRRLHHAGGGRGNV